MIIDNTKLEFEDVPDTLNDQVLLERSPQGFLTCSQEIAYLFSIATLEQQTVDGYNNIDFSTLDKAACNKPASADISAWMDERSQNKIDSLSIPEPAKAGLQIRIDGLLTAMEAISFDDGLRLALQLPIDIENT